MKRYYTNDEKSDNLVDELMEIQKEQLYAWKAILTDTVFSELAEYADTANGVVKRAVDRNVKFNISESIFRGDDIQKWAGKRAEGYPQLTWILTV